VWFSKYKTAAVLPRAGSRLGKNGVPDTAEDDDVLRGAHENEKAKATKRDGSDEEEEGKNTGSSRSQPSPSPLSLPSRTKTVPASTLSTPVAWSTGPLLKGTLLLPES
jgi:hypothetical protein